MGELKITEKTIDIKDVFYKKNPTLAKVIPGFVYNFLRKLVHEDEINKILYDNKDKYGLDFVRATLNDLGADIQIEGLENIPPEGKSTLISNHPLGGYDGLALMDAVGRVRKDLYFLANDILMLLPNLKPLFVPVNKLGTNLDYARTINEAFTKENIILVFPAGLVSRKINGVIQDLEWKMTFLTKSKRNKRDIIPAYVEGKNSNRFYNIARWRKKLGIKFNVEMALLVDELFRFKNKTLKIIIGKPVSYKIIDNRFTLKQWALIFREHVYNLKNNPSAPLDDAMIKKISKKLFP